MFPSSTPAVAWAILPILLLVNQTVWPHGSVTTAPPSAQRLPTPKVPGLNKIVKNRKAAIALGKALFWDMNVGSDGIACASCHFHAGADSRLKNQLNPGEKRGDEAEYPGLAKGFKPTASGGSGGPNYKLTLSDFPFHRFEDPEDIGSKLLYETDNVMSSSGSYGGTFLDASAADASGNDQCDRPLDPVFHVGALGTRKVEPRNTPTVINSVFNFRNFWDGRANNIFNGNNPFGDRDPDAGVWVVRGGQPVKEKLALPNSSLASQALGPPLSSTEMSCANRTHAAIGRKMLARKPLSRQRIHEKDSVLGRWRSGDGFGLDATYQDLVKKAFKPNYWQAPAGAGFGGPGGQPYTQMEANFGLFFGLAVQMYEATLVSNQSPYDRLTQAKLARYSKAMTQVMTDAPAQPLDDQIKAVEAIVNQRKSADPAETRIISGIQVFIYAHCIQCHSGPMFTTASIPEVANWGKPKGQGPVQTLVDRADLKTAGTSLLDTGFANTGVAHESFDPGLGGLDDFGNPLSLAAQYAAKLRGDAAGYKDAAVIDQDIDVCAFQKPFASDVPTQNLGPDPSANKGCRGQADAVVPTRETAAGYTALGAQGAFKIPTLRNVELTGPYMHDGGMATLQQVIEFYVRTGNYENGHKTGIMPTLGGYGSGTSVGPYGKEVLLEFLKSLTDERVRNEQAPFDHPQLLIPNGHSGDSATVKASQEAGFALQAEDEFMVLPAVGRKGLQAESLSPLSTFAELAATGKSTVQDNWVDSGLTPHTLLTESPLLAVGSPTVYSGVKTQSFYESAGTLSWNDAETAAAGENVHRGWTHNSRWARIDGSKGQKLTLTLTNPDNAPGVHPAFVLFYRPEGSPLGWPGTDCGENPGTDCVPAHFFPQQADWVLYGLPENPAHNPPTSYLLPYVASAWDGDRYQEGSSFTMHPTALEDIRLTDGTPGTLSAGFTLPETGYYLLVVSNVEEIGVTKAGTGFNIGVSLTQ